MIETKVPKDVRSYKTKIIGPLTLRQLICVVAALVFDGILYYIMQILGIKLSMEIIIYAVIFLDLPILAFTLEIQNMPLEKYIAKVLLVSLLKPNKRKVETLLFEEQKKNPLTKKEKQERDKIVHAIGKKNPDLKPFD